jgi:hypothetical protein
MFPLTDVHRSPLLIIILYPVRCAGLFFANCNNLTYYFLTVRTLLLMPLTERYDPSDNHSHPWDDNRPGGTKIVPGQFFSLGQTCGTLQSRTPPSHGHVDSQSIIHIDSLLGWHCPASIHKFFASHSSCKRTGRRKENKSSAITAAIKRHKDIYIYIYGDGLKENVQSKSTSVFYYCCCSAVLLLLRSFPPTP